MSCGRPQSTDCNLRVAELKLFFLLIALLTGAGSCFAESSDVQSDPLPLVTMDSVLERKTRQAVNVQWLGAEQLMVETIGIDPKQSFARSLSLDGALGNSLGEGSLFSASPDGSKLIRHTAEGWVVNQVRGGNVARSNRSVDEHRGFYAHSPPKWSPDSQFAAIIEHHRPAGRQAKVEPTVRNGVPIIEMENNTPALARWVSRLAIFSLAKPSAIQRISLDGSALEMAWSADNVLFVTTSNLSFGDPTTAVVKIRPGSPDVREIYRTSGRYQGMVPAVHPAGNMLALVLDVDNRTWSDFTSILLIDADTGEELRRLTYDLPVQGDDYVWSQKGDEVYARVGNGGLEQLYAIPLNGKPRQLTRGPRRHKSLRLSPDARRLSYRTIDGYGRKDIRVLDLATGEENTLLVLDAPADHFTLGEWRHIQWQSTDGIEPFGHLFLPPYFDSTRQYPMIVDVHGGGEGSRLSFRAPLTARVAPGPLEWHAWAALGYVVFVPDYRSSGDYGPEVIAARYRSGKLAAISDIDDILAGTSFVVQQGFVDASRVAILGNSAGGHRVYILLTRHDQFAAAILNEAIPPDPVSTFISLASGINTGGYPAGIFRQMFGGNLDDVPHRYKSNYMFDSYRITTPTLIMLGNEALGGTFHMPNEVLYSILSENDVPTRLIKFSEEGHAYSRPASARLAFNEMHRWLKRHMPAHRSRADAVD